jgi:pyruvate formate lyase activating enzyme
MSEAPVLQSSQLEARNPFELRVNLGRNVPEADVRTALANGDMGFFHSFTTGSAVDGPGVRLVAWLAGCQWRCLYCHNPDTWTMTNGIPVTLAKATEELSKYRHGLKVMSGGITVSGGEPLLQHHFVLKLLAEAQRMGIHTAMETNGNFGDRLTENDLLKIDLVLLGMKIWDPAKHRRLTGMEPAATRRFAQRLSARNRPVWVRFVLVPGLTDDWDDIARIAEFSAELGNVERVEVLPFHQLGKYKWNELRLNYELADVQPPWPDSLEHACAIFRAAGLTTV